MKQRKCKNKKCSAILPNDHKYKFCEGCMNSHVDTVKKITNIGSICLGIVGSIYGIFFLKNKFKKQ